MYMMERENVSEQQAIRIIENVDKERKEWSEKLYGIDTWDCRLYDLAVNIGSISLDEAAELICQTVKYNAFQTTAQSQQQIEKKASDARENIDNMVSPFFEPMRACTFCHKEYR